MLTQDYLKSILHYCPDTGVFTWKHRTDVRPEWNTRHAGKIAGSKNANGYISASIFKKREYIHRLAYMYMTGNLPAQVDHKNGIRDDNRWSNIRACNNFINSRNQKKRSTNTSGFNGVYWCKVKCKWYVRVGLNGKNLHGGYFVNKEDAINARKEFDKKLGYFEKHGKEKGA